MSGDVELRLTCAICHRAWTVQTPDAMRTAAENAAVQHGWRQREDRRWLCPQHAPPRAFRGQKR